MAKRNFVFFTFSFQFCGGLFLYVFVLFCFFLFVNVAFSKGILFFFCLRLFGSGFPVSAWSRKSQKYFLQFSAIQNI